MWNLVIIWMCWVQVSIILKRWTKSPCSEYSKAKWMQMSLIQFKSKVMIMKFLNTTETKNSVAMFFRDVCFWCWSCRKITIIIIVMLMKVWWEEGEYRGILAIRLLFCRKIQAVSGTSCQVRSSWFAFSTPPEDHDEERNGKRYSLLKVEMQWELSQNMKRNFYGDSFHLFSEGEVSGAQKMLRNVPFLILQTN